MLIESITLALFMSILTVSALLWLRFVNRPAWSRMQSRLDELESRIKTLGQELEQRTQAEPREFAEYLLPRLAEPAAGMLNLTKRTQAIRLLREGQSAEQVSHRLHIAKGEVELIKKISQIYVQ